MKISNILWYFLLSPAVLISDLWDCARMRWLNELKFGHTIPAAIGCCDHVTSFFLFSCWVLLLYNVERWRTVTRPLPGKGSGDSSVPGSGIFCHGFATALSVPLIELLCRVFATAASSACGSCFWAVEWFLRSLTVACSVPAATSGDSHLKLLSDVAQTVKGQGTIAWVNCG